MTGRGTPRRPIPRGTGRRDRSVRRASAGLSKIRAGAALVVLLSAAAMYGVSNSSAFEYARVRVDPVPRFTDPAAVEAALAPARGRNLFAIDTEPLEAVLEDLRTVASAHVTVELPGTLLVAIRERTPILVWQIGERRFLADDDGFLFASLDDGAASDATALPVIEDHRAASAGLALGGHVATVDLDAATRLGSLVPADIGSVAERLTVALTDENGFVIRTRPASWSAIFGFYTASLRTPTLIPGQVRLLRSLLVGREAEVDRVILASETDGTFTPLATPEPDPSAGPSPSP